MNRSISNFRDATERALSRAWWVAITLGATLVATSALGAVDDCGEVLEPEIVAGQQHGGSVAGVAQAIWEYMGFDPDGQPTTANFTTYGLPSAPEVPPITTAVMHTLTERNSLGSRGIGENGCNGATAAVHNAVMDALSSRGVEHIDLPLTPEKVWRAINSADAD